MPSHGCDAATAHDATRESRAVIRFGGTVGYNFEPRCLRVRAGATIVFEGPFTTHPLQPGAYSLEEGAFTEDPRSPFAAVQSGTEASFPTSVTGVHPFFCDLHVSDGMTGAVFVE